MAQYIEDNKFDVVFREEKVGINVAELILERDEKVTSVKVSNNNTFIRTRDMLYVMESKTGKLIRSLRNENGGELEELYISPSGNRFLYIHNNRIVIHRTQLLKTISINTRDVFNIPTRDFSNFVFESDDIVHFFVKRNVSVIELDLSSMTFSRHCDNEIEDTRRISQAEDGEITIVYNGEKHQFDSTVSNFLWIHPTFPIFASNNNNGVNFCNILTGELLCTIQVEHPKISPDGNTLSFYYQNVVQSINISFIYIEFQPFFHFLSGEIDNSNPSAMSSFFGNNLYDRNVSKIVESFQRL